MDVGKEVNEADIIHPAWDRGSCSRATPRKPEEAGYGMRRKWERRKRGRKEWVEGKEKSAEEMKDEETKDAKRRKQSKSTTQGEFGC